MNKNILRIQLVWDVMLLAFALLIFIYTGFSVYKIITTSAPDFPVLYLSSKDLILHKDPYTDRGLPDIFEYPPVTGFFYVPFLLFSLPMAQGLFVVLNAMAVPVIISFSLKVIHEKKSWREFLLCTSLAFISFPVKFTLGMGQNNLVVLLLLLIGLNNYQKKRYIASGVITGLSVVYKPITGFILLFYILRKSWKVLAVSLLTIGISFLLAGLLFGSLLTLEYFQSVLPPLMGTGGREVYYNQSAMGFIARLTTVPLFRTLFSYSISGICILTTVIISYRKKIEDAQLFGILLILLLLFHTLSWQHHFVFLIFPFIVALIKFKSGGDKLLLFLLFLAYVLVSWNIRSPSFFVAFPQSLILSHTFYGAFILVCLLLFSLLF